MVELDALYIGYGQSQQDDAASQLYVAAGQVMQLLELFVLYFPPLQTEHAVALLLLLNVPERQTSQPKTPLLVQIELILVPAKQLYLVQFEQFLLVVLVHATVSYLLLSSQAGEQALHCAWVPATSLYVSLAQGKHWELLL